MIFAYLVSLQMIIVNLFSSYHCLHKRKSLLFTLFVYIFTTTVIFASVYLLSNYIFPEESNVGNGSYILIGILYYFPLKLVSKQKSKEILVIMFSTWIYTMLIFVLSNQISLFFTNTNRMMTVFITQTILHVLTYYIFIRFMKIKFLYVLSNINSRRFNNFLLISILWFLLLLLINYSIISGYNLYLGLGIFLIIATLVVFSYKGSHFSVLLSKKTEKLELKSLTDSLTKLKNRECLIEDSEKFIKEKTPFHLIYIDLDSFKSINDKYGHETGDNYLVTFSENLLNEFGSIKSNFYRISGDEFIILHFGEDTKSFLSNLNKFSLKGSIGLVKFLGLSFGNSQYPKDGEKLRDLLSVADSIMYEKKRAKQKIV